MANKSVLVVEDESSIRKQLAQALEMEGYAVLQAGNGKEALELLLGLTPATLPGCIILDLMMPVMDGSQFVEIIESTHRATLGHIPIVVATAKGSGAPTPIPQTQQSLKKPFELEDIYAVVEKLCGPP